MTKDELLGAGWTETDIQDVYRWRPPSYYEIDGKSHHFTFECACHVEGLPDPVNQYFLPQVLVDEYNRNKLCEMYREVAEEATKGIHHGTFPNY